MSSNLAPKMRTGAEYHVGRYRILARLGKGGMGIVYLGRDEALDRDVAIKTLRVGGDADEESRGRFEIEAKAAARLQHPNIVTVFELGEDRGLPFIAMELLGGDDLETLLRAGETMSPVERLDIVIQTLRGLEFAHGHRIVHRDMKPSNIRVLDDGAVKILDFGIAKVESASVTRAGMMVGTPYYMSPEHIRGGVLDGRSDVFAMGVILHELFAGERPFTGKDPTGVLYRIVGEAHPRLTLDAAGNRTPEVQRVIDRALEKDADSRFGSAAQMADELARVRERYPSPAVPEQDAAVLNSARRNLSANRADPRVLGAVEDIARRNPDATEPQRLLRMLRRKPAHPPTPATTGAFPELDETFGRAAAQADATVVSEGTRQGRATTLKRKVARAEPKPPPPHSNAVLYAAVGLCLITGSVAAFLYFSRGAPGDAASQAQAPPVTEASVAPAQPPPETPGPTSATSAGGPAAAAALIPVEITSEPPGATVLLDRKAIGVTPLSASLSPDGSHSITLSLRGYESKEVRISAPIPGSVSAKLVAEAPPATLVVEASYPVTVSIGGRVVSTNKSGASVPLSAGTHVVLVESAAVFLSQRESVRVEAGGSFTIRTPATGKLGVRANPDNCKVYVNGTFVDYPPIIDRNIAAGNHVIGFEWPDGAKSEQNVEIQAGRPAYVMGRKP